MAEKEDEQVKEKSNASLAKAAVKNFCEASTIHGISSIFSATNIITRVFWIAMFVSVCSLLFWQISRLIQKMNAKDVVMTNKKVYENELEFPVVIFSNADPYSKAKLMQFPQTNNSFRKIDHLRKVLHNLSFEKAFGIGS